MRTHKTRNVLLAICLITASLAACESASSTGLVTSDPTTVAASVAPSCEPVATGAETASATWDLLPRVFRGDASSCSYFAARRGTCGSYQWIQFETGGLGDSTLMYFDSAGSVVYTELSFDVQRDCADGTKDFVCRAGCKPTACAGTVTETIAPGSAKAPADCRYSNPGLW